MTKAEILAHPSLVDQARKKAQEAQEVRASGTRKPDKNPNPNEGSIQVIDELRMIEFSNRTRKWHFYGRKNPTGHWQLIGKLDGPKEHAVETAKQTKIGEIK